MTALDELVARHRSDQEAIGELYAWRMGQVMARLLTPPSNLVAIHLHRDGGFTACPNGKAMAPFHVQFDAEGPRTIYDDFIDGGGAFRRGMEPPHGHHRPGCPQSGGGNAGPHHRAAPRDELG